MVARVEVLPSEDYEQLRQFPDGIVPPADKSVAIVARYGTELVARMFIVGLAHIEGTYIREDHRNGSLAVKLIRKAESVARERGQTQLLSFAENDEIAGYMKRLGYSQKPWTVWAKEW